MPRYKDAEALQPDDKVPTLRALEASCEWVYVNCRGCLHHQPFRLSSLIQMWGWDASSNVVLLGFYDLTSGLHPVLTGQGT
jgi:hypothetical protein